MSHYLGQCASLTGKNYFSNLVSVQQLDTLIGRRRIATNLGMSIKYHTDACEIVAGMLRDAGALLLSNATKPYISSVLNVYQSRHFSD